MLSVSRCSPQPTFLPKSQYLRNPIDDSLRDDLLPWIPQALRFIGKHPVQDCLHQLEFAELLRALLLLYLTIFLCLVLDGAMSLGCSVLVHCAAGISRSPALAVAYIMYRLGMDLDHAYRCDSTI